MIESHIYESDIFCVLLRSVLAYSAIGREMSIGLIHLIVIAFL